MTHSASSLSSLPILPTVYRLETIHRTAHDGKRFRMRARLFNNKRSVSVAWTGLPDLRLHPGVLVDVRYLAIRTVADGELEIARLVLLDNAERSLNLFDTVPSDWVADRDLVARAGALWESWPLPMQELFNLVFWNSGRFRAYCSGPGSMNGHHAGASGNLRHSVNVTECAIALATLQQNVDRNVLTFAAMLHDAGKAEEYRPGTTGGWRLTDRGRLLGHKITVVEWLAVARSRMRQGFPDVHYLSLLHALTAAANPPGYVGLRSITTPEAVILSAADRVSGQTDLIDQNCTESGHWGHYHRHLGSTPYLVKEKHQAQFQRINGFLKRLANTREHDSEPTEKMLGCIPIIRKGPKKSLRFDGEAITEIMEISGLSGPGRKEPR